LNDDKKDLSIVLYEASFKKERIKLFSTLPVLCVPPEENCKLEFVLGVIENKQDIFRVSDCGNNTSGNLIYLYLFEDIFNQNLMVSLNQK
jgi:hypothetical protein